MIFVTADRHFIECDDLEVLIGLSIGELVVISQYLGGELHDRWIAHRDEPFRVRHIQPGEEARIAVGCGQFGQRAALSTRLRGSCAFPRLVTVHSAWLWAAVLSIALIFRCGVGDGAGCRVGQAERAANARSVSATRESATCVGVAGVTPCAAVSGHASCMAS
jgi:hypothetical protein